MRYLVANLKMKLVSKEENIGYLSMLSAALKNRRDDRSHLIVCPSFPFLGEFGGKLPREMSLGAQDVAADDRGAFTGDVSPLSLVDFGVNFAIVGHSERREYHVETDDLISKKVAACVRNGINPILCVGETEAERSGGATFSVIRRQVESACQGVSREEIGRVIIAYEPRWAIGADRTPTADEILEVAIAIRRLIAELFDRNAADAMPILYGGSVSADRASDIVRASGISGVLVGREGLVPAEIAKLLEMLSDTE